MTCEEYLVYAAAGCRGLLSGNYAICNDVSQMLKEIPEGDNLPGTAKELFNQLKEGTETICGFFRLLDSIEENGSNRNGLLFLRMAVFSGLTTSEIIRLYEGR